MRQCGPVWVPCPSSPCASAARVVDQAGQMGAHHRGAGFVLLPTGQSQPQGKGGDSCSQGDELVCTGPAFPGEHGWGRKQQRPKGTCFSYCPMSGGPSEWGQARLWWPEGPFRLCSLSCSLAQEALCGAEMLSLRQERLHRTPPSQLRSVCAQLTLRAGGCEFCHLRD